MRAGMLMIISATSLLAQEGDGVGKEVDRQQARSMVITKYGIVATSQTLASAVGVKVLEAGGNAIDAAMAANATLGLVEPTGAGMGGALFAIGFEAKTAEAARIWLPGGKAPVAGQWFRNPTLAKSLRMVSKEGRDGLYRGPIAESIVAVSKSLGGTFTLADLADFQPEWVEPISTEYRGWKVMELPPNGMGIAALGMLNIMERFPLASYGHNSAQALHVMIEAKKLAYADMLRYTGDMRFAKVPVSEMTSKGLGVKHAGEINPERASCKVTPAELISMSKMPGADTIYMTVIDAQGNMISLIQSNFAGFGSGVAPLNASFMLQNRGGLFSLEEGAPNALAPRKRPLHTIIPGFMQKDDVKISFGIMGGWNQSQAHAQFVSNIVDFGMTLQGAMEAPRFTKSSFDGCDVQMESRMTEPVVAELKKKGHDVRLTIPYSQAMGGGQVVMQNGEGIHFGASDARNDGAAPPEAPNFWKKQL